jgi:hypothetical protein
MKPHGCKIKAQVAELGEQKVAFVEPKQDVSTKKVQIVVDSC